MIRTNAGDPFSELIAQGHVSPLEPLHRHSAIAQRVLRPTTQTALIEVVRQANRSDCSFTFIGGGTSLAQTPNAFVRHSNRPLEIGIGLECLNRVVEYRPMDFAITVEAGMPVAHLREILAMRGQTITLDTPEMATSTIGGLLASARCGPRRRSLGRPRDALVGANLVLGDGAVFETKGRSLRQAKGYNLARLFVGSHGSLGAYATVTLRTRPLPEARRCAIATLPEGTRERVIAGIETLAIEPTAALLLDGFERKLPGWEGPDGRLILFFEGSEDTISRATRDLRTVLGAIGISETRIFDREAESLLDQLMDAPLAGTARDSTATMRLYSTIQSASLLRARIHRLTAELGVVVEMITDLQNDDVIARVRASGPRALEIAARETFIRLAGEIERADLVEAPAAFRQKFEESLGVKPERSELINKLKSIFDPNELCAVNRSTSD